jgi:hypothetical protein
MMKCWLEEWLDFLFPEPVEVDMDGEPAEEIPRPGAKSISSIPDFYKAEPAVREAERVVRR